MKKGKKQLYKENNRAYLKQNRTQPGVIELPSGVQYRVLKEGEGKKPIHTSLIHVYYTGKLVDGKVFDENINEPFPALFRVFDVVEGWKEVMPLMAEGGEVEIVLPYEMGYGKRADGNIPGFSTLIFNVKLIKVE